MPQSIENGFQIDVKVTHLPDYELVGTDSHTTMINGLGVVGQQPILEPGESFTYTSACPIISSIGQMSGYYTFLNLVDQSTFKVHTPTFELITNYSLN